MDINQEEDKIEEKEIEIVNGDGSEIDLSPVYEHLNALKPKPKDSNEKKKQIIIPEVKSRKEETKQVVNHVTIKMDENEDKE